MNRKRRRLNLVSPEPKAVAALAQAQKVKR